MSDTVLNFNTEDSIGTITLNREAALNALNSQFFSEMASLLKKIQSDQAVKAVIITGAGKAFAAGADIAEMAKKTQAEGKVFSQTGQQVFDAIEQIPQPVIAAVNGFALGGGCELAMACDIRIASSKAKLGQPEVNLGLIPGYAGTQRLPRLVGLGNAFQLLFTGDLISAEEAHRIGLVQQVVEPDQLIPTCTELAKKIIQKGPKAVQLVKSTARQGLLSSFEEGCRLEAEKFSSLFENEGAEGMAAFLEKRAPAWQTKEE